MNTSPAAPDLVRTRHVSARVPEVLFDQVELVRVRQRQRHFSDALIHVLDRGLDAIANEQRKPERLESMVARIDDLTVTVVAILNLVHELEPNAVAETRELVLASLRERRKAPPAATAQPAKSPPRFAGFGQPAGDAP